MRVCRELEPLKVKIIEKTETVGKKTYPLKIIKRVGLHEVEDNGQRFLVEASTVFESPLGTSRVYTEVTREASEEERALNRKRIDDVMIQTMRDLGVW